VPSVPAAVQLPAALVLAYKRHQRGERFWRSWLPIAAGARSWLRARRV